LVDHTLCANPAAWLHLLSIRQGKRADLPALEWEGEYVHFRRIFAEAYQSVDNRQAIIWLADLQGIGLIGQLFVSLKGNNLELADGSSRAYIYGFRVRPAFQNCGVGTRLMHTVEDDLVKRGFQWITLNVGRDNYRARHLYERLGYHVVKADPGNWSYIDHLGRRQDVREPAWRMEKKIC
jgi:ribosomal protein S18 acetylase RimI-like enzyme